MNDETDITLSETTQPCMHLAVEGTEQQPLMEFTEKAYLDYSMYVILDRALPYIGDGLKPVQRRIIYAMSELGLKATAKFKKSARTVGDVLGKFHPHGDTACYEAMVLMAQGFSYRYPLVDGQGNWGSQDDPKSFAAMRYTESRLSSYADLLLKELSQGAGQWGVNFDGTLKEPTLLPARLPNILLNGASGIAVGMSTDILPHNVTEVATACVHLLKHPQATLEDIHHFILAPDLPTGAEIITTKADLLACYRSGTGSIKVRATYTLEDGEIVIDALPYQVSGAKILTQVAAQMQAKKLPMVSDLRDESDHEQPTRIVICPRSNRVDIDGLMSHLFATTDLEKSYRVNMNVIGLDGRPQVKGLLPLLNEWLSFRLQTVRQRLQYRLDKILARLHILDGLLVAYLNIDEVIRIIRTEDEPKPVLIKHFQLTTIQAEAILELKLRHLAKLEEMRIRAEQDELAQERDQIEIILASDKKLKQLVAKEIQQDSQVFGDERRSQLVEREGAVAISQDQMLPAESIMVVLSKQGWVRAAKGHDVDPTALSYKAGDAFLTSCLAKTNQLIAFFDQSGRSYSLQGSKLPSARGQGEPLTSHFKPESGCGFSFVTAGKDSDYLLLCSSAGYGFLVKRSELYSKNKAGKSMLRLPFENSKLLMPQLVEDIESQYLVCVTNVGRLLSFPIAELPVLSKGKGNKMINMPSAKVKSEEEWLASVCVLNEGSSLTLYSGKRHFTLQVNDLMHYQGERGRRGNFLPRGFRRVDGVE